MTHTYKITGMTCSSCQARVQQLLSAIKGVKHVAVDLVNGEATINMEKHIPVIALQLALKDYPKYQLVKETHSLQHAMPEEATPSWLQTYKPILLIGAYILIISLLLETTGGDFIWMRWMNHFMAGFFLTFSFFKLLDIKGFAESYGTYDIAAKQWSTWGYIYPFVELLLGLSYLVNFQPQITNAVTFVVMAVSLIGVLQSVLNKQQIRCACLGAVFNLPMSTITIMEDALMIVMSAIAFIAMI